MLHLIHKLSQFIIKTPFKVGMYAEIEKVGGLKNALNIEFNKIGSELKVSTKSHFDKIPVTYARVEKDNKFSQIYILRVRVNYTCLIFGVMVFALHMVRRRILTNWQKF